MRGWLRGAAFHKKTALRCPNEIPDVLLAIYANYKALPLSDNRGRVAGVLSLD